MFFALLQNSNSLIHYTVQFGIYNGKYRIVYWQNQSQFISSRENLFLHNSLTFKWEQFFNNF